MLRVIKFIFSPLLVVLVLSSPGAAQELITLMPGLLNRHEQIKAAEDRLDIATNQLQAARKEWYPKLDLSVSSGREWVRKPDDTDTAEYRNVETLRSTQLLTDFGATDSMVHRAEAVYERTKVELDGTRQQVMLAGITSCLNLARAREKLLYARKSEDNIIRQTGMEETLVKHKAGLSSDVLQTKSQLAGARALRVIVEGELELAKNRFKAMFKRFPTKDEISSMRLPKAPEAKMPADLETAIETAMRKNPRIVAATHNVRIAEQNLVVAESRYSPRLNLFAAATHRENDLGTMGTRNEGSVGVELNMNLFNGTIDRHGIKAARAGLAEAKNILTNARDSVEEQVRNAWQNLFTSRINHQYLRNQSDIVGEFLKLARKERKLGTRSLLDVLNGEITYINSVSRSVSAKVDTLIATYQLFYAMGELRLELL